MAGGFRVVQVARPVDLEAHRELVKMLGDLVVVVETFDPVGFEIPVQIMKAGDLVPAGHVDDAVYDFQAQGLEKPGADSSPFQFLEIAGNSIHQPNASHPSANGRPVGVVRKEVKPTEPHPGIPRVLLLVRYGQDADGKGVVLVPLFSFRGNDPLAKTGRASFSQRERVGRFGQKAGDGRLIGQGQTQDKKPEVGRML